MRIRSAGREVRILALTCLTVLSVLLATAAAHAQEPAYETQFSVEGTGVGTEPPECPMSFPSLYRDEAFGVFWGRSALTMQQWDEYHTYKMYTYRFTGTTLNAKTRVTGIHHVNALQCREATASAWLGIPAVIAVLHLAQFTSLACGDTGSGGTQIAEVVYDPGYDPYDGGISNGGGGGCDTGSDDSTSEEAGIQYRPGDSTGGETVGWSTGTGNGGSSVCGSQAVVEYVCIDIWNDETGTWEEWSCGYATTC